MVGQRAKSNVLVSNSTSQAAIEAALGIARRHLRRQRAFRALVATVALPTVGIALWIGVSRFSLLELPRWPALVIPIIWLVVLAVWWGRQPVSRADCARYLDTHLELEERLSTCLELQGRARLLSPTPSASALHSELYADTAQVLEQRSYLLPDAFRFRIRRSQVVAPLAALALLLIFSVAPTPFDKVKSEQTALRSALDTQAKQIADLRAEIVARPGIPEALKQSLSSELAALEQQLKTASNDRADALAALADVEQKVHDLLPGIQSSDFDSLVRAAQLIEAAASTETDWDPSLTKERDELGKAAEALQHIQAYINQFSAVQARSVANSLERAAAVSAAKDAALGQSLQDAGTGLRRSDDDKTSGALEDAYKRFRDAENQQQSAQAIENTLAKVDEGRESIAKAGTTATKKGQVGFRRTSQNPEATPSDDANSGANPDSAGNPSQNPPSGINGARIGQSQPAFGSGSGNATTQQSAKSGAGSTSGGAGGSQGGPGAGKSSTGQAGGSSTGTQGPGQGQISGPIRVGGGQGVGGDS